MHLDPVKKADGMPFKQVKKNSLSVIEVFRYPSIRLASVVERMRTLYTRGDVGAAALGSAGGRGRSSVPAHSRSTYGAGSGGRSTGYFGSSRSYGAGSSYLGRR